MFYRNAVRNGNSLLALLAGGAICAWTGPMATAQVVENFPVFDLNGDGASNQVDFQVWEALRDASDSRADLDGNGLVDSEDERLARRSSELGGDAGSYAYHWSVREHWHQTNTGRAPISRDTQLFPQFKLGKYPHEGYQQMMADASGSVTQWHQNYDAWMSEHLGIVRDELIAAERDNPGFVYGAIDYEAAMPVWSFIQEYAQSNYHSWRAFLSLLHRNSFDQQFVDLVGYTPPAGANKWSDLDARGRIDLCEASWNHFGQDFYNRTLAECRRVLPDVKWGMFNIPKFNMGVRIWGARREINNDFGWLLAQLDFFAPSFYRAPFVWDDPISCRTEDPEKLMQWYQVNMEELVRLREQFNPDAELFGFVFVHYHPATCAGQTMPAATISDQNLRAAIIYPRLFGADGIMIWHPLPRVPNPQKPWLDAQQLGAEMDQRWSPYMIDWQSGMQDVQSGDDGGGAAEESLSSRPQPSDRTKTTRTAGVLVISGSGD